MLLDDTVIAGLIVIGGTLAFMVGIGIFVYQDTNKKHHESSSAK